MLRNAETAQRLACLTQKANGPPKRAICQVKYWRMFSVLTAAFSFRGFWMALFIKTVLDRGCGSSQSNQGNKVNSCHDLNPHSF